MMIAEPTSVGAVPALDRVGGNAVDAYTELWKEPSLIRGL
jgi:hypothetical protein